MKQSHRVACVFIPGMIACGESAWDGVITEKNGVRFVENKGEPLYRNARIHLIPRFTIGGEELKFDGAPFDKVQDVAVSRDGNTYVSDGGNARIVVFDSTGRFLKTFGHEGGGPGEFMNLSRLAVDEQNLLYALDTKSRKISLFTPTGKFIRSFAVKEMTFRFSVKNSSQIFLSLTSFLSQDGLIAKYDTSGAKLKTFGVKLAESDLVSMAGETGQVFCADDAIFYAFPYPYRIEKFDYAGNFQQAIMLERKGFNPPTPAQRVADKTLGGSLSARTGKLGFAADKMMIVEVRSNTKSSELDFFSNEGKFLQAVSLPEDESLGCVHKNDLYTFVSGRNNKFAAVTCWKIEMEK